MPFSYVRKVDASPERLLAVAAELDQGDAASRELAAAYRRLAEIPDEDTRRRLMVKLEARRRGLRDDATRRKESARKTLIDRRAELFRGDPDVTRAEMDLRRLDPAADAFLTRLSRNPVPDGGPRRPEDDETFARLMALSDQKVAAEDADAFWPFLREDERAALEERIAEAREVTKGHRPQAVLTRRDRLTRDLRDLVERPSSRTPATRRVRGASGGEAPLSSGALPAAPDGRRRPSSRLLTTEIHALVAQASTIIRNHERRLGRPLSRAEEMAVVRWVLQDHDQQARAHRPRRAGGPRR